MENNCTEKTCANYSSVADTKYKILLFNCPEYREVLKDYTDNIQFVETNCSTDIIAVPCDGIIADISGISDKEVAVINSYYTEVDYANPLFLVHKDKRLEDHEQITNLEGLPKLLQNNMIQCALDKSIRFAEDINLLTLCLDIMQMYKDTSDVTYRAVIEKLNVRPTELKRYIQLLTAAGIIIEEREDNLHLVMDTYNLLKAE